MDDFYPKRENFLLQNRNCRQKNVEGNAPPVLLCLFALSFAVQFPAESAKSGRKTDKPPVQTFTVRTDGFCTGVLSRKSSGA